MQKFQNNVDLFLNKSKIVFESGINEFDDKHLLAFNRILDELQKEKQKEEQKEENEKNEFNIYAIDNSDPRTWWSDTMIGYLALLSKIKPESNVHRIFICQKNELLSPIFAKTIGLHSLMGFKTYVIVYDKYIEILKTIDSVKKINEKDKNDKYDIEKEVFIWTKNVRSENETTFNVGTPFEINFDLDELHHSKKWSNVKCYQSFWNVDSDYNFRQDLHEKDISLKNYYGSKINSNDIKIWFEFIAKEKESVGSNPGKNKEWIELPLKYLALIDALLKKMICCKEANELPDMNGDYAGVEIRTENKCPHNLCKHHRGGDCINKTENPDFDFTTMSSVKAILQEYYNKLK